MRKLLLTTTLALPLTFGAALAQDTAPMTEPADTAPVTDDTAPMTDMGTAPAADPMATDPMATDMADDGDAAEAAAAASAADKVEVQQAANEWRIDWISGTTVTSPTGENIGSIDDLIVDGDTGEMKAAIVGVGGFLGIGTKQIALPWTDLTVNSDAREITSSLTREEADAAPEYVFRDQADAAGGMMTDTAADPAMAPAADPMATDPAAPAGDPMATGGMTDAPADPMATDPATDMGTTEPMDTTPAPAN